MKVRAILHGLAEEAGVRDPAGFAIEWQILMFGAIIAAVIGDTDAALRARETALLLLQREGMSA